MGRTYVIAEAACTWRYGDELDTAKRSIEAAKRCGADAWKTQWTSDPVKMAARRGMLGAAEKYKRLSWPIDWHDPLKRICDEAGIEYMCTTFLPDDIGVVAPFVSRFKVSAYEHEDDTFLTAHNAYTSAERPVIVSCAVGEADGLATVHGVNYDICIYCVSEYPTPLERLHLSELLYSFGAARPFRGLSDHTKHWLTGALAVAAGAEVIEKHVCLNDCPFDDPDYGHSLGMGEDGPDYFLRYIWAIREAEKAMGS